MASRNPTDWMWAQACELMDRADRMHRQFFRLSASGRTQAAWEPPVDVFEDSREFIVIVALPGVAQGHVEIAVESGTLIVRAERRIPFAGTPRTVRRLEIPYGLFERRIELPQGRLDAVTSEFVDGCLLLRLRKIRNI